MVKVLSCRATTTPTPTLFLSPLPHPCQSSLPGVRRYLECCAAEGLDVRQFSGSFVDKAGGWTTAVRRVVPNASFVFPLDLDEFLVFENDRPLSRRRPVSPSRHGEAAAGSSTMRTPVFDEDDKLSPRRSLRRRRPVSPPPPPPASPLAPTSPPPPSPSHGISADRNLIHTYLASLPRDGRTYKLLARQVPSSDHHLCDS